MERTAEALRGLGHEVIRAESADSGTAFDVLHVFGSEPATWHLLRHTNSPAPVVVTPVISISPGREQLLLWASARAPVLTSARMRKQVLARADAIVAATAYEKDLVTRVLGGDERKVTVISNGGDASWLGKTLTTPEGTPSKPFGLMVGAIYARKRQEDVLRAVGPAVPIVVVGAYADGEERRAQWQQALRTSGAVWLGPLGDPAAVAALERAAFALVHFSAGEVQSLSLLEALALGTPAVVSDIPSHRELAELYPEFVYPVQRAEQILPLLEDLRERGEKPRPPRKVPDWSDVAAELVGVYRRVLAVRPA